MSLTLEFLNEAKQSIMENTLVNIPFDDVIIGSQATLTRTLVEADLIAFAHMSGDTNPVHLDENYAKKTIFKERIAHGMWTGSIISCALATKLPGPGGIYLSQQLNFLRPVKLGDTITVTLTVTEKNLQKKIVTIKTTVTNQNNKNVVTGFALVKPETNPLSITPSLQNTQKEQPETS